MPAPALGVMPDLFFRQIRVQRVTVPIDGLSPVWVGLKMLQVSDCHFARGRWASYWAQAARKIAAEKPDLILFTGDVAHHGRYLQQALPFLANLKAPLGKVACLGNHDYSDFAHGRRARRLLEDAGFTVLVNAAMPMRRQDDTLWISGVDDPLCGKPDVVQALDAVPPDALHIVLTHSPNVADEIAAHPRAPQLMLAGHTHGGHVQHPLINALRDWLFGKPTYRYGLYTVGQSQLYVTSGLARSVAITLGEGGPHPRFIELPPLRVGSWPEISVFTLTAAEKQAEKVRP